jgi:hypothetical protein
MAISKQTFEQRVQYAKHSLNFNLGLEALRNVNPPTLSLPILDCFFGPMIGWIKEDKISCSEVKAFFQEEYEKLSKAVETKKFSRQTINDFLTQIFLKGFEVYREEEEEEEEEEVEDEE